MPNVFEAPESHTTQAVPRHKIVLFALLALLVSTLSCSGGALLAVHAIICFAEWRIERLTEQIQEGEEAILRDKEEIQRGKERIEKVSQEIEQVKQENEQSEQTIEELEREHDDLLNEIEKLEDGLEH